MAKASGSSLLRDPSAPSVGEPFSRQHLSRREWRRGTEMTWRAFHPSPFRPPGALVWLSPCAARFQCEGRESLHLNGTSRCAPRGEHASLGDAPCPGAKRATTLLPL